MEIKICPYYKNGGCHNSLCFSFCPLFPKPAPATSEVHVELKMRAGEWQSESSKESTGNRITSSVSPKGRLGEVIPSPVEQVVPDEPKPAGTVLTEKEKIEAQAKAQESFYGDKFVYSLPDWAIRDSIAKEQDSKTRHQIAKRIRTELKDFDRNIYRKLYESMERIAKKLEK